MEFRTDNRGVSEVIGAILVFGLMIALIAMLQLYAIPAANEQVEANHNLDVQSDLIEFQETVSRTASQGVTESARIRMGTTYPNRLIFFNPSPPSGMIQTEGESSGRIEGITATNENVGKYVNLGTVNEISGLETKRLEYEPNYNEFQNAPTTVLEYGTLYYDYGDGNYQIESDGNILSGNVIDLTFFGGDLSHSSTTPMALEARPASAPSRTVMIEPEGDENVELVLPSNLPAQEWRDILQDEQHFENVSSAGSGMVRFQFNGSVSNYELKMAQIGIGNDIPENEGQYLIPSGSQGQTVISDQSTSLPFEARDKYNNPASGENVSIQVNKGGFESVNGSQYIKTTTNQEGKPIVTYSSNQAGEVQVKASLSDDLSNFQPNSDPYDLQFNFTVDPAQDPESPDVNSLHVTEHQYAGCAEFLDIPIADLLGCLTPVSISQFSVNYDVQDTGGSGLDYIEFDIYNSSRDVLTTTHNIDGSQSSGIFQSSQINREITGNLTRVEYTVHDNAGNENKGQSTGF